MSTHAIRIVVGIDFGPSTDELTHQASLLAEKLDAELHLCHVFPYTTMRAIAELVSTRNDVGELIHAKDVLQALRETLPAALAVQIHLRLGSPAPDLMALAEELDAAHILVGTRGHGLASVLGSVATRLVARSPIPVTVIRVGHQDARTASSSDGRAAIELAWSCARCGHIRSRHDEAAHKSCSQCNLVPGRWDSAPYLPHPDEPRAPAREDIDVTGGP